MYIFVLDTFTYMYIYIIYIYISLFIYMYMVELHEPAYITILSRCVSVCASVCICACEFVYVRMYACIGQKNSNGQHIQQHHSGV